MIVGQVNEFGPAILLKVFGAGAATGMELGVSAIVDTGFSEEVSLPPDLVAALALPYDRDDRIELANGRFINVPIHEARIEWDGQTRTAYIHALENTPAIGMGLLRGCHVSMDGDIGGQVTITAKP